MTHDSAPAATGAAAFAAVAPSFMGQLEIWFVELANGQYLTV